MNNEIKLQAVNVYEKKSDLFNVDVRYRNEILDLVLDEDKHLLIPYIVEEIKAAKHLGKAGAEYAHELEHLKAMLEKEVEA